MMTRLITRTRAFLRSETGNISLETAIWVPVLLTMIGSLYALHHSWRADSLNTKAAYAIADALSRETNAIDDSYLDGMVGVMSYITGASADQQGLRVSLVRYDQDTASYEVEWSQVRGEYSALTETTDFETKLPLMFDQERVILVETVIDYVPPFNVPGLAEAGFISTFGVTRPRFAPKIVWADPMA